MSYRNKGKAKNILARLSVLPFIILTYCSTGFSLNNDSFHNVLAIDSIPLKKEITKPLLKEKDEVPKIKTDNAVLKDTTIDSLTRNVVDTFSFKTSKDSLDAPVVYHADDSMVLDVPNKKILLYGKTSNIKYTDNNLTAPYIEYDQKTSLVKAYLQKDSLGNVIAFPAFEQGDFKSVIDTIQFNMKTGKGLTKGTYTQQGEMYVYGKKIKKIDQNVFYALDSRFTTCNLDTPHFAFVSHKVKFINKKMAFTGPVHPEFEGVPLPIYLPFGIFPLTQGKHSGLLAPTFTSNEQQGIALENLGYYKILSDNWDLETRGTLYSYGGWSGTVNTRYMKRYHYQGRFSFTLQKYKLLDEPASKTFRIAWNHSADSKARPGVTFSANVDASSTKFNSQVANNPITNFNNQQTSHITYAKTWKDKPFNISINANHSQNSISSRTDISFPDIAFNVNTLYPFRRKGDVIDFKWYENIGIALNTAVQSRSFFYDSTGHSSTSGQLKDNLAYGASHSVPISLSLPPIGPFQISPSISYSEQWFQRKDVYKLDDVILGKIDTTTTKGFYRAYDMAFGASISTRIFGMFTFNKKSRIQAIRHEIRPSLSFSYHPDFNSKFWYSAKLDTSSLTRPSNYSVFQRNIYQGYSPNKSGQIGLSIDNVLSMKVKSRKDTGDAAIQKVSIIDGFTFNTAYDLLADTFKLQPISVNAHTNLFKKLNVTFGASFDPYQVSSNYERLDKYVWAKSPISLGRLTYANIALQSSFKGGDKSKSNTTTANLEPQNIDPTTGLPLDEYQQEAAYVRNNPGEFVDFAIPWSVDFSYSFNYIKTLNRGIGFSKSLTQSVTFNTSANFSPKWKVGVTGSYNITTGELGYASVFLSRDMHCWQMTINIAPVGKFRFFSINISPKSAILRDLKVNRTRSFISQ